MLKMLGKIIKYKRLTSKYPKKPVDTTYSTGVPKIDSIVCNQCGICIRECPSKAIALNDIGEVGINVDECIFCARCADVCPSSAVEITKEFELATKNRTEIRHTPFFVEDRVLPDESYEIIGEKLKKKIGKRFKRSLQIREVDAGSCNGCDYEINALNNPFNDIERFGIHFVASPRHADMLLVTGTASRNMELALVKTYNSVPDPKLVVAVGACACSGGLFKESYATRNGIDTIVPVDVYIPGCPPRPQAILYGILKAIERI